MSGFDLRTDFIWTPDWQAEDDREPRIVLFRKRLVLPEAGQSDRRILISADSRYKLYVNGTFVQEGPQKPLSLTQWFVDEADIGGLLFEGENIISVEVLRYPPARAGHFNYNASLLRSDTPMLYVKDTQSGPDSISARTGWHCCVQREITVTGEKHPSGPAPVHVQEQVSASARFFGWKLPGYNDSQWFDAECLTIMDKVFTNAPCRLTERTIPPMRHCLKNFTSVTALRSCDAEDACSFTAQFEQMLAGHGSVSFRPNSKTVVEFTSGVEDNGYLLYAFAGGAGAKIETCCAECYSYPQPDIPTPFGGMSSQPPLKGKRTDSANGTLVGCTSSYTAAGCGTLETPEIYEPFWFRTFRFIRITVETGSEPLILCSFTYRQVGYPLDVQTVIRHDNEKIQKIWDICVRTLRLCMLETYVDCPFYEQMQYAMDSRTQILYTYALSADDRLARQTMEAFRLAQRPDGLLSSQAPTCYAGVIPGFSLYYVLMIWDHMMYFGDRDLVRCHLPAVDRVLNFFDEKRNEDGLVGKLGGSLLTSGVWSFLDWSPQWNGGVPAASGKGSGNLTMESLLYLYALQKAAELAEFCSRKGLAEEYRQRAQDLLEAIRNHSSGSLTYHGREITLVQDGCGIEEYSVHCQALAVLTGVLDRVQGRTALRYTVNRSGIAQPTVAFMFYVFRAMEECEIYEDTAALWDPWRKMLENELSTCVENETDQRSDCHGWGALMCYELPSGILGLRPTAPGYSKAVIHPCTAILKNADAELVTPKGVVYLTLKDSRMKIHLPEGIEK